MHPAITAQIAEQHRRDLVTQADAYRLARTARNCRPTPPRRPSSPLGRTGPVRALRRAAATAAAAAGMLMLTPAGATTIHHFATHVFAQQVYVHSWSHSGDRQLGRRWA